MEQFLDTSAAAVRLNQAVKKCEQLTTETGKQWFFKANKGIIKLDCEED